MRLLIEDFPYPSDSARELLCEGDYRIAGDVCRVSKIGYYYNPLIRDCVFILPKVILDYHDNDSDDTVFGNLSPLDIIDVEKALSNELLNPDQRNFIYNFSTWIYRAIFEYAKINDKLPENQQSKIIYRKQFHRVDHNGQQNDSTLLDTILSLIRFANENREYFMFIIRNIHSGYNKIHWNKTISKKDTIICNGAPYYIDTVNRKKQINFDEELLIIFYSILAHVRDKYGFPINFDVNYQLITGYKFESYIAGLGKSRLLQIKYKYFSDKALQLWHLCYNFFTVSELMSSKPDTDEYLLVSDFDIVFETMIDTLISENNIPVALRNQRDGKIVDHIYPYTSLISSDNIYYIGDSKYYKIGGAVHGYSEYKQYTYARNVIHYNINLLLRDNKSLLANRLLYRDSLTEGYNPTPNFFISAEIDNQYRYNEPGIHLRKNRDGKNYSVSRHFENRLFDRDTLWLSHYSINFLYVVALFISSNQNARDDFKARIRQSFREHLIGFLNGMYDFYIFNGDKEDMESFVNDHFRELSGKLFHFSGTLIMALEKGHADSTKIHQLYSTQFSKYQLPLPF